MRTDLSKAVVLFIDDDRLQRKLVAELLAEVGATIVTAANADQALDLIEERRPDLILCDAVMPVTDGWQFCKRLKDDPGIRDIPFAILTSLSQNVGERSLQAGADDFFLKKGNAVLLRLRIHLLLEIALNGASVGESMEAFAGSRVMAASSSALLLSQLTLQMAPAGIQVRTCPGAQEVLASLDGPPPALLILDAPLEGGFLTDVTQAVRKQEAWRHVPILVVVGKDDERILEAQEGVIQDWITKPLDGREARRRAVMLLRYGRALQLK